MTYNTLHHLTFSDLIFSVRLPCCSSCHPKDAPTHKHLYLLFPLPQMLLCNSCMALFFIWSDLYLVSPYIRMASLWTTLCKIASFSSSLTFILPCWFFFLWIYHRLIAFLLPSSPWVVRSMRAGLCFIHCYIPTTCSSGWHSVGTHICCRSYK